MPRLEDLFKNLQGMTPDELRERIRQIRTERRIYKEPSRVKRAKAVKTDNTIAKLNKLLEAMTPEQKAEFLQGMENE